MLLLQLLRLTRGAFLSALPATPSNSRQQFSPLLFLSLSRNCVCVCPRLHGDCSIRVTSRPSIRDFLVAFKDVALSFLQNLVIAKRRSVSPLDPLNIKNLPISLKDGNCLLIRQYWFGRKNLPCFLMLNLCNCKSFTIRTKQRHDLLFSYVMKKEIL